MSPLLFFVTLSFVLNVEPIEVPDPTVCVSDDIDFTRGAAAAGNIAYEATTLAEGVAEIAENFDPSGVAATIKYGLQFAKIGVAVLRDMANHCYERARRRAEDRYHKNFMDMINKLNAEMEKATRKLMAKFSEMEQLLGNVTVHVTAAVNSIKAIHVREAKEIWKEVTLDYSALLTEFKLSKKDKDLTLFFGYCFAGKMKDPESVLRRFLSILEMENNPLMIISAASDYTDASVNKYLTMVTMACGQLSAAAEVCMNHKAKGGLSRLAADRHLMRRNKLVNQVAEALNSLNSMRETHYFNKGIMFPVFSKYNSSPRGYSRGITEKYTLFYMDTEEFLLRRKYIYSIEYEKGRQYQQLKGPSPHVNWHYAFNSHYVKCMRVGDMLLFRTHINDPDIFVPKTLKGRLKNMVTGYNGHDFTALALDIYNAFKCKAVEGKVFLSSVYVSSTPSKHFPFYGFGKCYNETTKTNYQVVGCFKREDNCAAEKSPTTECKHE